MLSHFRLHYKAIVIKTVWYWHKNRDIDQWNRTEISEINPFTYAQLVYDKSHKNIQQGKGSLFNEWYWVNWTATRKRMKLEYFLTPHTKLNSKRIKNLKLETIKLLKNNTGSILFDINLSSIFFSSVSWGKGNKI